MTSSIVANRAAPSSGLWVYSFCKAGILGMLRQTAVHTGEFGVRVNAVTPGLIVTDIHGESKGTLPEMAKDRVPLKRAAMPEEVAKPVCFLLSDAAAYVTGIEMPIDGGWCLTTQ